MYVRILDTDISIHIIRSVLLQQNMHCTSKICTRVIGVFSYARLDSNIMNFICPFVFKICMSTFGLPGVVSVILTVILRCSMYFQLVAFTLSHALKKLQC